MVVIAISTLSTYTKSTYSYIDLKRELADLENEIMVITAAASDPLMSNTRKQEDNIVGMSVKVKKL